MTNSMLMIVSLRIAPKEEAAFNEFYHHSYIPALCSVAPEFANVWRYEEFGVTGSLRWFNKEFLTIYEIAPGVGIPQVEEALLRAGREAERAEWARWKETSLHDVQRHCYREIYRHRREPWGGIFASRPFFRVSVETAQAKTEEFNAWYHGTYLPKILADVPAWSACRRYSSVGEEPARVHTIYEAESAAGLEEAFSGMRAPHRYRSNADWDRWVGPAITWQDATSFRPIFRYPG